jgi:outer membrane protein assembly factor BamB
MSDWFSSDEKPLEGERISVLELQKSLEPDSAAEGKTLKIPSSWRNQFWPQSGGYPNHSMQNLTFNEGDPKVVWRADIGKGSTKALPLTAQPVVIDGHIFTLDTQANLRAFSIETGKSVWETSVDNTKEDDPVIGGGIAYSGQALYVTNGYDELLSVDPKTGAINWRTKIPAPSRAAPTIINERIFVVTLDNRLFALNESNGAVLWDYSGINEVTGLLGMASPAANQDIVVPAFSSGEISALRVENGSVAWSDNLSNLRGYGSLSGLSDIKAMPIIDQGIVFAISFSGKLVAIDERSGARIWQREIGGSETPWLAGGYIYLISEDNQLVALNRKTGQIFWISELPKYEDEGDKEDKIFWTGPVMAGGKLYIASSNGQLMTYHPENGDNISRWNFKESFTIAPIVAGGTMYLLSEEGTLIALR